MDDGIGGGPTKEISQAISRRVQSDVDSSGFLWHPEKSSWEPSQSGEVLGFLVDLEKGFFEVPDRRIKGLQERLKYISQGPHHTARDVAQITGTIVSMGLALGPVARLWTRGLYRAIMQASTWGEHIQLDEGARQEITFWRNNFELCHGQPIRLANPRPEILTYSDASNTGWGGYSVEIGGKIAKGSWLEEEKLKSSRALDILWGPHTVDRFSSFRTRQIPRFCSRYLNPMTEQVDAFTADWSGEMNWMFPPPYLVPRVIRHMRYGGEDGTLIVPLWTSAPWWPLLTTDGRQPQPWIVNWMDLPLNDEMFIPAVAESCLFGLGTPAYRVLALRICFSGPPLTRDCGDPKLFL